MRLARWQMAGGIAVMLAGAPAALSAQDGQLHGISVPVTSCQLADSLLGPLAGKHSKLRIYLNAEPGPALFIIASDQVGESLRAHSLSISFRGTTQPMMAIPAGDISLLVTGDAGRYILSTHETPAVSIALADSVVITPHPVSVGTYDGPPSFAVAPLSAPLTAQSLLAIARSDTVVANIGTIRIRPSPTFRTRLRDGYRVALCGYRQ